MKSATARSGRSHAAPSRCIALVLAAFCVLPSPGSAQNNEFGGPARHAYATHPLESSPIAASHGYAVAQRTQVPNVVGMSVVQAERELSAAHLQPRVDAGGNAGQFVDRIVTQYPLAQKVVPWGTAVALRREPARAQTGPTVSGAAVASTAVVPVPVEARVPRIIGMTLSAANDMLRSHGFELGNVTGAVNERDATVERQSPGPDLAPPHSAVNVIAVALVAASGLTYAGYPASAPDSGASAAQPPDPTPASSSEPTRVPNVTGMTAADASKALETSGLKAVADDSASPNGYEDRIDVEKPEAGTLVNSGSRIRLQRAHAAPQEAQPAQSASVGMDPPPPWPRWIKIAIAAACAAAGVLAWRHWWPKPDPKSSTIDPTQRKAPEPPTKHLPPPIIVHAAITNGPGRHVFRGKSPNVVGPSVAVRLDWSRPAIRIAEPRDSSRQRKR